MRKMTASQKLAHIERRIAKLEREASIIDDVAAIFKKTINIPKNLLMNFFNSFTEIFRVIRVELSKKTEVLHYHLGVLLTIRIARSFTGITTTKLDLPKLVKFDANSPLNSIYTGGIVGRRKVKLSQLIRSYDGEQQRRIKSAYVSWHKDYEHIINPKLSKEQLKDKALRGLKRYSKVAYRFFTAALTIASGFQIAVTGILFDLVFAMGSYFNAVDGYVVTGSHYVHEDLIIKDVKTPMTVPNPDYQDAQANYAIQVQRILSNADYLKADAMNRPGAYRDVLGLGDGETPDLSHSFFQPEIPEFETDIPETKVVYAVGDAKTTVSKLVLEKKPLFPTSKFEQMNTSLVALLLMLTEKIMYRWVINTDEYDEIEQGMKKASRYPTISYLTHRFESSIG
jgi:hypothetical protein